MALEGWARCKVEGGFLEYMIKVSFVVIDDGGSSFDSEIDTSPLSVSSLLPAECCDLVNGEKYEDGDNGVIVKPVPVELRLILGEESNNFASSNGVSIFDKVGRSWKLGDGLKDISLSKE